MQNLNDGCKRLKLEPGFISAVFNGFRNFSANVIFCNHLQIRVIEYACFWCGVIFAYPFKVLNRMGTGSIAEVIKVPDCVIIVDQTHMFNQTC